MFSLPSASRASRRPSAKLTAGTAIAAVAATVLGFSAPSVAAPASPVRVFTETGGFTAESANAISAGWWGHEGSGRSGSTVFSLDGGGGSGQPNSTTLAAQLAKIGPDATLDDLHVAFVLTSSDGSAEKPAVSAGQTVGQVFHWFDASTTSSSLAGNNNANDYVDALSTEASYNAWYNAGQPVYGFDNNLVAHDAAAPGDPASGPHAIGTSILNTWPAGTNVSLVYYVSTSVNANNEPIVAVGPDGHAETAWVPLTTVALPADHSQDPVGSTFSSSYDTVRTSAGYVVDGAAVTPTLTLKDSWSAGSGTLTASLTDASSHALTNATGTIQFQARAVGASGGTFTNVGSPVTVNSSGIATAPITGLTPGQFREFQAVYMPDSTASSLYTAATSNIDQAFDPYTTTTTLSVGGTLRYPYHQTLGAAVASSGGVPDGTVTFLDKGVSIGTVALNSTGHASLSKGLSIGTHLISVRYNGSSNFGGSTSAVKSVAIGKDAASITLTFSPIVSRFVHGSRPKVTTTVKAYGLTPTGTVTIAVYQPNRRTITLKGTLRGGKLTLTLPALLRGTTKLTVKYLGSSTVGAATKVYSFKVTR